MKIEVYENVGRKKGNKLCFCFFRIDNISALFFSPTRNDTKDDFLSKPFLFFLDSTVYTPEDGDNWMLAKLNLQITDLGYSQIVEHLGKVNIVTSLEKIIVTHST